MNEILALANSLPADLNPVSREGVLAIEQMLHEGTEQITTIPDIDTALPLTHRFADGVYGREMFIPAGTVVVGKIHRFGHLNVITRGKCVVLTEFGVETIKAPYTFVSMPGTKRVVGAIEDTVWTTFHGVGLETDLDVIESNIICKTFADFDALQLEDRS